MTSAVTSKGDAFKSAGLKSKSVNKAENSLRWLTKLVQALLKKSVNKLNIGTKLETCT